MMIRNVCCAAAIVFAAVIPALAEAADSDSMLISAVYGGAVTNKASFPCGTKGQDTATIKDTGFMTGLYLQWIEVNCFQLNAFLYGAPDVNYSRVLGVHTNADGYFLNGRWGSFAAGIDLEDINIRMKAGSHLSSYGYSDMTMTNNVLFMMARAGARFKIQPLDVLSCTIFPYAGITRETVRGKTEYDLSSPYVPAAYRHGDRSFSDDENYFSWGTNVTFRAFHFLELTAKYLGRAKKGDYMNSVTGQAQVYLTRSFGITWQTKYMEIDKQAYDLYNLLGVSYIF